MDMEGRGTLAIDFGTFGLLFGTPQLRCNKFSGLYE